MLNIIGISCSPSQSFLSRFANKWTGDENPLLGREKANTVALFIGAATSQLLKENQTTK